MQIEVKREVPKSKYQIKIFCFEIALKKYIKYLQ